MKPHDERRPRDNTRRLNRAPPDLVERYLKRLEKALAQPNVEMARAIINEFGEEQEGMALAHVDAAPLFTPIHSLGLAMRTVMRLEGAGLFTIGALLSRTKAQLLEISEFGPYALDEVFAALARHGYRATPPPDST